MKKLIVLALVFCSANVVAQSADKPPLLMGDALYTFRYENINGTPFWQKDWMKGKIITTGKKVYENQDLKLDLVQNNFVFERDGKSYSLTPDVWEVQLSAPAGEENYVFRRGFAINKFITPTNFVQVLAEAKTMSLLKYTKKVTEEYSEYNDATKYKRFRLVEEYFIFSNMQAVPVVLNKKSMEAIFGSKWAEVETFMKRSDLSPKDQKAWVKVVASFGN